MGLAPAFLNRSSRKEEGMSSEQLLIYLNTLPLYVAIPETFYFQLLWGLLMPQKYQLILSIISTYPYQDISDLFAHFESVLGLSLWRTGFEILHFYIIFDHLT